MRHIITTQSGSRYILDDDRITRLSEQPLLGAEHVVLRDEQVFDMTLPEVGHSWRVETLDGWFVTSRVADIRKEAVL